MKKREKMYGMNVEFTWKIQNLLKKVLDFFFFTFGSISNKYNHLWIEHVQNVTRHYCSNKNIFCECMSVFCKGPHISFLFFSYIFRLFPVLKWHCDYVYKIVLCYCSKGSIKEKNNNVKKRKLGKNWVLRLHLFCVLSLC